jgi:catechol 2,3-dioxygenase
MNAPYVIPAAASIGHVNLKVADLDRSLAFYQGILGFELIRRLEAAAFVSAGGYHHHIALNTWDTKDSVPPAKNLTGLHHLAILFPTRADLAVALQRVLDHNIKLTAALDHGVSEALYMRDPDNNGVELYWDRPKPEWPTGSDGKYTFAIEPLDVDALRAQRG